MNEPSHGRAVARGVPRKEAGDHRARPSGFDFTSHIRRLCGDLVGRLPSLDHIQLEQVAVAFSQTRKRTDYGLYASMTPMRFQGGSLIGLWQGRRFRVEPLVDDDGRDILYILTVYLPRFMDLNFREKVITILHELWHISPAFDGDLRRHEGRCYAHSHAQKEYDSLMSKLATEWMAAAPPADVYGFLDLNFAQLQQQHGRVFGNKIARPHLLPLD